MHSEETENLKIYIEDARKNKEYSQRDLAQKIGMSQSTYNDIINGKIKKINPDNLKSIATGLDLDLKKVLELSGYGEVLHVDNIDEFIEKAKQYNDLLFNTLEDNMDMLLKFDSNKQKIAVEVRKELQELISGIKDKKDYNVSENTLEEVVNELEEIYLKLHDVELGIDNNKLKSVESDIYDVYDV